MSLYQNRRKSNQFKNLHSPEKIDCSNSSSNQKNAKKMDLKDLEKKIQEAEEMRKIYDHSAIRAFDVINNKTSYKQKD